MFPYSNLHTHTIFSDGKNTAEEMALAAIERGFTSLGFSDHGYSPYDVCGMSLTGEAEYRAEVARLKAKYADTIELALGYEHDSTVPDTDLTPYDYAIESVHFVYADGLYMSVDESRDAFVDHVEKHFGGDPFRLTDNYFDRVCEALSRTTAEIAGHIDLVTKFDQGDCLFDTTDPRYRRRATEAVEIAVKRDRIVEVNTGAMSRGYRKEPYPSRALLQAVRDLGGRVMLSSDCHDARWIDYGFDQALELVKVCGFKEVWVWKDGGFEAVGV